jgi:hypothetical protein
MDLLQAIHSLGRGWRRKNLGKSGTREVLLSMAALKIVPGWNSGIQPVSSTSDESNLVSKGLYMIFAATSVWVSLAAFLRAFLSGTGSREFRAFRKANALTYLSCMIVIIVPGHRHSPIDDHLHFNMLISRHAKKSLQANL